tara:strand:- start:260 stop:907 length:648 start_codon:yes stop_codon:yes gene_type:complete
MARAKPKNLSAGVIIHTTKCGPVEVVKYISWREVVVIFINTGFVGSYHANKVLDGMIKDPFSPVVYAVGFFGVGPHKSRTKCYYVWKGMFWRCYSETFQKRQPTYIGCSVSSEWHNYQVFAEWFYANYTKGLHLDKDIKVRGNRVYSPDLCLFVTQKENNLEHAKDYKFTNPVGDVVFIHNLKKYCNENGLDAPAMYKVANGKLNAHKKWKRYSC